MSIARMNKAINREAGFTLVELMVVVTIAGLLIIAFGAGFVGWREKYFVESDVKTLHTVLMEAKLIAKKENRYVFVNVPESDHFVIRTYVDTFPPVAAGTPLGNGALDLGSGEDELLVEKTFRNELMTEFMIHRHFWFDAQGLLMHENIYDDTKRNFDMIFLKMDTSDEAADADYNCLAIQPPNYFASGLWNTTECVVK